VLLATLTRLELSLDLTAAGAHVVRALHPTLRWADAIDGLRNVALFAGLGAVWVATTLAPPRTEIGRATLVGLGLSALVEGLQVFSPIRSASIVDLATNAGGAFLGAFATAWMITMTVHARGARSYLGVPSLLVAGTYGIAVACEALTPLFRSAPEPGVYGGPLTRLRLMLGQSLPVQLWQIPWLDIPLYAPAGFLGVMLMAELGWATRRAWPVVASGGVVLCVAMEIMHGGLGLSIRWEAALTHALAVTFGAWAAPRWLSTLTRQLRGAARARWALAAYTLLLVLWAWRPLLPRTDLAAIAAQFTPAQFIPLGSVALRADVFSALHVLQQFFLYFPLGAVLAVWPLRARGLWAGLRPALVLAVLLEVGHFVIDERLFDVTNALLACAGLALGWTVLRRSGFAPYGEALTTR
jgi:VanZ family protein